MSPKIHHKSFVKYFYFALMQFINSIFLNKFTPVKVKIKKKNFKIIAKVCGF